MANITVLANIRLLSGPRMITLKEGENNKDFMMETSQISEAQSSLLEVAEGVHLPKAAWNKQAQQVLTPKLIDILAAVHRQFNPRRLELLQERIARQAEYDMGDLPGYLDRQSIMVTGDWRVAPIPADLLKRRVEITGPVSSAKMVINMLSRNEDGVRADCAMLDFEDSMKPSWPNVIQGIANVRAAVDGTLTFTDPRKPDKEYTLDPDDMPIVMVRVRGLHLAESNFIVDGEPISAGLFDFLCCLFHTGAKYVERGLTPKYYVPKCEHHLEAKWWNELFTVGQECAGLPVGTLRATFLIETLPAAFQMEEILYQIRAHAAGLNGGRWDKIFSDIKTLKFHADRVLADRGTIDMKKPWMEKYAKRIIEICHARGAFAMGGMSAFTPGKEPEVREQQLAKVTADKRNEAAIGHDGCWVSHPFFIGPALAEFKHDNQLGRQSDLPDKYPDLLPQASGPRTEDGVRKNVRVGIAYMNGWIQDIGCVAWDGLMEDLATLEISRAQIWQWLHHNTVLDNGTAVTKTFVKKIFEEEYQKIIKEFPWTPEQIALWGTARRQAEDIFLQDQFPEFLCSASDTAN